MVNSQWIKGICASLLLSSWVTPADAQGLSAGAWGVLEVGGSSPSGETVTAEVWVYEPAAYEGASDWPLVIALPGWNSPGSAWRDSSVLAELAERHGFVVVAPSMGRSVYERDYYPETTRRWSDYPGLPWIVDVVIPFLDETFSLSSDRAERAVIGYSTGGRGAILLAATTDVFGCAAGFSGTYDLAALDRDTGEYRIHAAVFGSRRRFPGRWQQEDLPDGVSWASGTRLYLSHGAADAVVPDGQTAGLLERLREGGIEVSGEIVG
ncbi:MAG: prolyl oligopeptidase family serine peptidase, partial [Myxococcales bacterium]|nr:prolyl oligopeptidase family serine peptidase [Myxococcales bacterium]